MTPFEWPHSPSTSTAKRRTAYINNFLDKQVKKMCVAQAFGKWKIKR